MSDYLDWTAQDAALEGSLLDYDSATFDSLLEDVENGPYGHVWALAGDLAGQQWPADSVQHACTSRPGSFQAPEDGLEPSYEQNIVTLASGGEVLACDFEGCKSKPFKRSAELRRHQRKHRGTPDFACPAQGCKRKGDDGFFRHDKLTAHMLAGHDEDTLFNCAKPRCDESFPRDLFAIHSGMVYAQRHLFSLLEQRRCPMPKCPFKLRPGRKFMDTLQHHLLEKHEIKARANFAGLITQRGYDIETCSIQCPVCPRNSLFSTHAEFYEHFLQTHFCGPACGWHGDTSCSENCHGRSVQYRLLPCTSVPDEVRQHRRTILSLWPAFASYPVWDDIKCLYW